MSEEFVAREFEHAGLKVEIVAEQYVDSFYNPRECDQLAHMAIFYDGYDLGDEELPRDGLPQINCPVCDGGDKTVQGPIWERPVMQYEGSPGTVDEYPVCYRCENYYMVDPTMKEWLIDREAEVAAPLFIYEHGGMTIKAGEFKIVNEDGIRRSDTKSDGRFIGDGDGWDTSFVGFVYVTRERAFALGIPGTNFKGGGEPTTEVDDLNELHAEMIRQAESEVREYAMYLEGDAGGFVIKDEDGEVLDSTWGFLGLWEDYVTEEAKWAAERCREDLNGEANEAAEWAARDVVTA
jgi:hypothetical protein